MTKLLLVVGCFFAFYLASLILDKVIRERSIKKMLGDLRVRYVTRLMNIGLVFCCIVVVCLILGLGYSEVSVFLS